MAGNKPKTEHLTTTEAIKLADQHGFPVSRPTIVNWCKKYKIGFRLGYRWKINQSKFVKFLKGR